MGLGVILLDDVYPAFPGDVRNPSDFAFPIQYDVAEGVDIFQLVRSDDKAHLLEPILRSARRLEKMGCRAIAAECGYFAWFQREIAGAVSVPVFASSLLQVPLAQAVVGSGRRVGVLMASKKFARERHFRAVGLVDTAGLIIHGAMDGGRIPQFHSLWNADVRLELPGADYDTAEREFVEVGVEFARAHPDMGAMVLECTGFPPFARALQQEIDIPLFSWSTLLEFAWSVSVHRGFAGHV